MKETDIQETTSPSTLVIVLGMHRSGTSAITRALETMGADFGTRLMPAVTGVNDKGFFEDLDIVGINMEVMSAAGADWHTIGPIDLSAIPPQRLDELQTKATALLRDKCRARTFALKDPRIARLLPFWQPVFACLEVRAVYVIALRNPISVAQSLAKRNGFAEEKSYLLWLAHMVPALTMTRDCVRTIVDYDRLMDSPQHELSDIATRLNLPLNSQRVAEFEQEFLDNDLRHTRYASKDLGLVRAAPPQVKALFTALELATCPDAPGSAASLDAPLRDAQQYLDDIESLLRYEWNVELNVQRLHAINADSSNRINELNIALAERDAIVAERDAMLAERGAIIAEREAALAEQDNALAERNRRIEELDNALLEAHAVHAQLEHLDHQNLAQQSTIHSLEQTVAQQRGELSRSAAITAQILASTSWRFTAPLRAIRRNLSTKKA